MALSGAMSGATVGSVLPGAGTAIGAGVGAAIGAGLGAWSWQSKFNSQKDYLNQQIEEARKRKKDYLENLDKMFELEAKEANRNADVADEHTTVQEGFLSEDVNLSVNQFRLQQDQEGMAWNREAIAMDQGIGNALSSQAVSGTRNSTMEDAIDMQKVTNSVQLQTAQDTQRTADEYSLAGIINQFNQQESNVQFNRNDANALRNSYLEGGNQYEKYMQNRTYNEKQFDDTIRQLKAEKKEWTSAKNYWSNFAMSVLVGSGDTAQVMDRIGSLGAKLAQYQGGNTGTNQKAVAIVNRRNMTANQLWGNA